ncbi:hypothetical protein [Nostoc sp.]|uniref:hypothetical protein n=1 Tax=Nostoc sp. TaxID=1180 RepID=UPI002FF5C522
MRSLFLTNRSGAENTEARGRRCQQRAFLRNATRTPTHCRDLAIASLFLTNRQDAKEE